MANSVISDQTAPLDAGLSEFTQFGQAFLSKCFSGNTVNVFCAFE